MGKVLRVFAQDVQRRQGAGERVEDSTGSNQGMMSSDDVAIVLLRKGEAQLGC